MISTINLDKLVVERASPNPEIRAEQSDKIEMSVSSTASEITEPSQTLSSPSPVMPDFQLLSADHYLLTKIINRLEEKSYFRLQQTSKLMYETIHSNKQICVHVSAECPYEPYYIESDGEMKRAGEKSVECFYGVRLDKYCHRDLLETEEEKKQRINDLKKHRVTCDKLDLTWPGLSTEHMLMLLDILKPRSATTDAEIHSQRYICEDAENAAVLLQSKTLETVYVTLDDTRAVKLIPKLFAKFSSVHIGGNSDKTEEQLELLHIILQTIRSQSCPHLRNVSLYPIVELFEEPTFDEVLKEFPDLTWTYERKGGKHGKGDWFWSYEIDGYKQYENEQIDDGKKEDNGEQNKKEKKDDSEDTDGPPKICETGEEVEEELIERFAAVVDLSHDRAGRILLENSSERSGWELCFEMGGCDRF